MTGWVGDLLRIQMQIEFQQQHALQILQGYVHLHMCMMNVIQKWFRQLNHKQEYRQLNSLNKYFANCFHVLISLVALLEE